MNIYLIGFRGTGKSSIAPRLADRLGNRWKSIDLDTQVEQEAGRSIHEIFESQGESTFRDLEQNVLTEVADGDRMVVATGGGIVLRAENRRRLHQGWGVWLTAEPETIDARLRADLATASQRPNLTIPGGLEEIRQLLEQRETYYRELAQLILKTDRTSIDELVDTISRLRQDRGDKPMDRESQGDE